MSKKQNNTPEMGGLKLKSRLHQYRASRSVNPGALAVTAAAAWTLVLPADNAHAVVNTFTFVLGSDRETFGSRSVAGSGFQAFVANNVNRTAGGYYIGAAPVSLSAVVSPSTNFPNYMSAPGGSGIYLPSGGSMVLGLRASPAFNDEFYGWISRVGNVYTVGFSDQPDVGVLAGTTTEVGAPPAAVPEPSTALPLLLLGAAGVAANRRRQKLAEAS